MDVPAVKAAGAYTVIVYATNSAGHGPESSVSTTVGAPSRPGAPTAALMPELALSTSVYPLAGDPEYGLRWIRAAWTPSNSDGGAPVTGYTATVARPEGAPIARSVDISACVDGRCVVDIPAVSSAGTYVVSVYAANRAGNSPEATTTVTVSVPAPPSNLTAVLAPEVPTSTYVYPMAGDREYGLYSLRATWTASSSVDGPPVTEYQVVVDRPKGAPITRVATIGDCPAGACALTVPAVSVAGEYTVRVHAISDSGNSRETLATMTAGGDLPTTQVASPSAVHEVRAEIGPTTSGGEYLVDISWDAATAPSGSAPTTGYILLARRPSGAPLALAIPTSACSSTTGRCSRSLYAVTGPGDYSFMVLAKNVAGNGPESVPAVMSNRPATAPGSVSMTSTGTTQYGKGGVRITWTRSEVPSGTPVKGYALTVARPGSPPSNWTAGLGSCDASGSCSSVAYVVDRTGSYEASVEAYSTAGNSLAGTSGTMPMTLTPSGQAVTVTPPSAPTNPQLSLSNGSLTLTWGAVSSKGGAATVTYLIKVDRPGAGPIVTTLTDSARSYSLTGLASRGTYSATVWASNAAGNGPPSSPPDVTLAAPASPPSVTGRINDGILTVQWSPVPAATDGGSAINGYTILITPPSGMPTVTSKPAATTTATAPTTLQGVYRFDVFATTAAGTSEPSAGSAALTTPTAVTQLTATIANGQFTAAWRAPMTDGGSPVTGYLAVFSKADQLLATRSGTQITSSADPVGGGTDYRASVPADGIQGTYAVEVTALSGAGNSPTTVALVSADVPSAAIDITAEVVNGYITVNWSPPAIDHGIPVTTYYVTTVKPSGATSVVAVPADPAANRMTTSGIAAMADGRYLVTVEPQSEAGKGPVSTPIEVATGTPSAPQEITAARTGDGTLTIAWSTPLSDGNSPVSAYSVHAFPQVGTALRYTVSVVGDTTITSQQNDHGTTTYSWRPTITGAGIYRIEVVARNSAGNGRIAHSTASIGAPGKVRELSATFSPDALNASRGSLTATWIAPFDNGGVPLTGYQTVWWTPTSTQSIGIHPAAQTSSILGPVTRPGTYTVVVNSTNSAGNGPARARNITVTGEWGIILGAEAGALGEVLLSANVTTAVAMRPGETETVELRFLNPTSAGSANERWIIDFPPEIRILDAPGCEALSDRLVCDIPALAAQGSTTRTVHATVSPGTPDQTAYLHADDGQILAMPIIDVDRQRREQQSTLEEEGRVTETNGFATTTYYGRLGIPEARASISAIRAALEGCSDGQPFTATSDGWARWLAGYLADGLVAAQRSLRADVAWIGAQMGVAIQDLTTDTSGVCRDAAALLLAVIPAGYGLVAHATWDVMVLRASFDAADAQAAVDAALEQGVCFSETVVVASEGGSTITAVSHGMWTNEAVNGMPLECR